MSNLNEEDIANWHENKEDFSEEKTIADYFEEWDMYVQELYESEKKLIDIKETYAQLEQEILINTDFKEIYGANNDKIRKNHVKKELKELFDTKTDLELRIDYVKRRIDFIKSLMRMQGTLMEVGVIK